LVLEPDVSFLHETSICGGDVAGKLKGYEGLETYSLGRRRSERINIAIHKA
jgi:hypothetical protein